MAQQNERANATPGRPVVLDPAVIDGLRELSDSSGPSLLEELIAMFLEDTPKRLEDMRVGFASGDYAVAARAAHTLKSSAANMGAAVLSAHCRAVEELVVGERIDDLEILIQDCHEAFAAVKEALEAL